MVKPQATLAGFFAALAFLGIGLPASAFDALYAFGDSLTDTWREPSPSPLH